MLKSDRGRLFNQNSIRLFSGVCLLGFMVLIQGCRYDPNASLYTTDKPQDSDVVGRYSFTSQTVTPSGVEAMRGRASVIILWANHTFSVTNVPPFQLNGAGAGFFSKLVSGSGTWRIDSVGGVDDGSRPIKTSWGIYLDAPDIKLEPVGLTGTNKPYGLIYTLGDPDEGKAMIFKRTGD